MDVRPDGAWRIDMRTPSGTIYPNSGVFLEVVENERLVYSDVPHADSPAWGGSPPGPYVHTVSFADHERGGTRVSVTIRADSQADCAQLLAQGMRDGMAQGLDRLGRVLSEIQAGAAE